MQESYKFQVNCRGGDGIVFEISPDQTLLHMMSFICDEWLEDYRNGDGSVYDHLWKFCRYEDDNEYQAETHHEWTREQQAAYENYVMTRDEGFIRDAGGLPIDVSLKNFHWWTIGTSVPVDYDTGSTTYFDVRLIAKEIIAEDIKLPRIAPDESDKIAESFVPFAPKEGTPNLNDMFPHANQIMFEMGSKWLCPYPCSDTSGGFVEGRGGDSDLVFIPEPFDSLQHALIGINRIVEECPQSDESGYSRSVWAIELSQMGEEFYNRYRENVQEYVDFQRNVDQRSLYSGGRGINFSVLGQYSRNIQNRFLYPQAEFYYRLTKDDVDNFEPATTVDEIFPLSAKAYKNGLWASYHRGKVKVCTGSDTGERGVPQTILAQVKREVHSLHEFFCVCEALFQMEKNNHMFAAIKKSVELDPLLINGKTKAN